MKKLIIILIPVSIIIAGIIMDKTRKEVWFEGSNEIQCSLNDVGNSLKSIDQHFAGIINLMPGMTSVELVEKGTDHVTIKTNEGLMKRSNIVISIDSEKILLEFDEEYQAGKTITTNSHFVSKFTVNGDKVIQHLELSKVKAPGFMGYFYRNFGSKNIGNAFLSAYQSYLGK